MNRLGLFIRGIIAGLGSGSIDYQTVALIGLIGFGAETTGEGNAVWFPIRAVVALSVARIVGGWVTGLPWRS